MKGMRKYGWVALAVLLADRASKAAARAFLPQLPGGSYPLWPGILHLTYAENTGVAFSMLRMHPFLLALLTFAVLCVAAWALRRWVRPSPLSASLVWALLAGGLGNLFDRIVYGYVVDFIELRFVRFAIFNVADIAITSSCLLLAVMTLKEKKDDKIDAKDTGNGGAGR